MIRYKQISIEEARKIGNSLGIDWQKVEIEEFYIGLAMEQEHGLVDPTTNVTNDDMLLTGKIALAHLKEFPDYYTRLSKLEEEAEEYWARKRTAQAAG